ncbi:phosphoglycerate mutase [Chloropicon primus]|uniref:Phosphoglycerate mutase n=1 Tax=Chloropicon primus TaxID=1764295 RepID=A0A5B8MB76_9CHLO|nr:phosphoglycerate mutase [Chloropicon primus]UPQ96925.1 phosphoglycerate mutase [Chloropicon primus]|mmetsp:Transcript_8803/g.25124  ORF Transcript_8803/g.25124 Transcript_8803/m.25124 type:complete len:537 (-) Transcript_8803:95-1705(-)|eukprot:QDZ17708.1 phosphoglycerate mutase [Chloropicon primus]
MTTVVGPRWRVAQPKPSRSPCRGRATRSCRRAQKLAGSSSRRTGWANRTTPVLRGPGALKDAGDVASGEWVDEFSDLGDRKTADPMPLPQIKQRKRVILVRHGQSTWNAEGRMQGSSNNSELTEKGREQAVTTKSLLENAKFEATFVSPLKRAQSTSDIVWSSTKLKPEVLSSLREIDLYSFQGLVKKEAEKDFKEKYELWKKHPAAFEIDGHSPVKELWFRASLAWEKILRTEGTNVLVVAHNAINQALLCSAIGLPPSYFRRFVQSNGAITAIDFFPNPSKKAAPKTVVDRMNQSPVRPSWSVSRPGSTSQKFVLIRHAATDSTDNSIITGTLDRENLNKKGKEQVKKINTFLKDLEVDKVFCSPTKRTVQTGYQLAKGQKHKEVEVKLEERLANVYLGEWQGKPAASLRGQAPPRDAESLNVLNERVSEAWLDIRQQAAMDGSKVTVIVAHAAIHAAIICSALELSPDYTSLFRLTPGSISVVTYPEGVLKGTGNVICTNFTGHLGSLAEPATLSGEEEIFEDFEACDWDGCF